MGLMRNYHNCPDCKYEKNCFFIKTFIQDSEYEYEIIPQQGLNVHLGNIWINFIYCPYCGQKIRTWHSNKHWHITEVVSEITKTYKFCDFVDNFIDNSGFEYKVGKDQELMIRLDEEWISLYYCPDCGDKIKIQ